MTQAYTRPGSTDVDYNAVSGDSVTSAAQKLDNAIDDIYTQIQDGSTVVKGVLQIGTSATQAAAGNKGVTNGNSHDHSGGDGGTIAFSSLSGTSDVLKTSDIGTSVQGYDADTCISDQVKSYTAQHYIVPVALGGVSGAIALNLDTQADVQFYAIGAITISNPTNVAHGKYLTLTFWGDYADYGITWGSVFAANADEALPTACLNNLRTFLTFRCDDIGRMMLMGKVVG